MSKKIRIGCASAFWGDTQSAAQQLVTKGQLDYLVFDYLAEITMSIMAGQKLKDPSAGYAKDFVDTVMAPLLPEIKAQNLRVISNAGGVNPEACVAALRAQAQAQNLDLKIVMLEGDSVLALKSELANEQCREMFSGAELPKNLLSMNAYLGAPGIVAALAQNADIIVTGRVVDSALVLAPLVHEFNWAWDDFDKLAQGSLAGHIIECGAQCTGGNFTDWHLVADGFSDMGFPIVEVDAQGEFVVSKPEGTGGLVSEATVAEQLVYEIGDPANYLLPDVRCDFSHAKLEQTGTNQVRVSGARGTAPTKQYKVSATWPDGFKCSASFLLAGIDAPAKAQAVAQAIIDKSSAMLTKAGLAPFSESSIELLGSEATYGGNASMMATQCREVVVKIALACPDKRSLVLFSKEIAQAATGMAPGITGIVGGRPTVWPKIRLFSCLIDKARLSLRINDGEQSNAVALPAVSADNAHPNTSLHSAVQQAKQTKQCSTGQSASHTQHYAKHLPLIKLAWARSGDKGNHANIGVIARQPGYLPYLRQALSCEAVAAFMAHTLHTDTGSVKRWELPGIHALNFLLENSLGGGGVASLRIDPQGKAFAQQLLSMAIPVPDELYQTLSS